MKTLLYLLILLLSLSLLSFDNASNGPATLWRSDVYLYELDTLNRNYKMYRIQHQDSQYVIGSLFRDGKIEISDTSVMLYPWKVETPLIGLMEPVKRTKKKGTNIWIYTCRTRKTPISVILYRNNNQDSIKYTAYPDSYFKGTIFEGFENLKDFEALRVEYLNGSTPIITLPTYVEKKGRYKKNNTIVDYVPIKQNKKYGFIHIGFEYITDNYTRIYRISGDTLIQINITRFQTPLILTKETRRVITYVDSNYIPSIY